MAAVVQVAVRGEGEELLPRARVVAQQAVQGRGDGAGAGCLDAAQGHAQVLGLEHHPDALGRELGLEPVGDLLGEPLLDLQAAGEQLDHPGQLGQAEDALAGQVADVGDPGERQQVVLAQRVERDVPGQHQLVVALVVGEGGQVERRAG